MTVFTFAGLRLGMIAALTGAMLCAYVAGAPDVFVPASGGAMRFNGDDRHRTYFEVTPKCHFDENPLHDQNMTLALWFRTSYLSRGDQVLGGFANSQGIMFGVSRLGFLGYSGNTYIPDSSCHPASTLIWTPTCWTVAGIMSP